MDASRKHHDKCNESEGKGQRMNSFMWNIKKHIRVITNAQRQQKLIPGP